MVKRIAFVGAQTGDEGKGVREVFYVQRAVKLHSNYESPSVWTMRWHGGANAGHTIFRYGEKYVLHQVPSGILIPHTYNLMGEGVFLEPRSAVREIEELKAKGVEINRENFGIASNAHVTLDYHISMDSKDSASMTEHTSTGKGIKPTAVDKYGRVGIRLEEFVDRAEFIHALKHRFPQSLPDKLGTHENFVDSYASEMEALAEFSVLQSKALKGDNFKIGICEGAQGFQLDVDRGLYPGITSSNPSIVPVRVDTVVGVVKLYVSSVGGGRPFVGQMNGSNERELRETFKEFGATTKKARNLGWLDIVAVKNAIDSSGIDCLVGTCGDRLEELARRGETIKLITGYKIGNKVFKEWDKSFHKRNFLYSVEPVFEEFEAWDKFLDEEKRRLTPNAQRFVDRIEELTGVEFIAHGHGQEIDDVLEIKEIL